MQIYVDQLTRLFRAVQEVHEETRQYVLAPDTLPVSIEDLQWIVSRLRGITIDKQEVHIAAGHLRGAVLRYKDGRAVVIVNANQTDVWKRFTAAKEICHLLIDSSEHFSANAEDTVRELLSTFEVDRQSEGKHLVVNKQVLSEHFAEIAATEILYPRDLRVADAERLAANEATLASLEARYNIPNFVIARALSLSYIRMCKDVDEALQEDDAVPPQ